MNRILIHKDKQSIKPSLRPIFPKHPPKTVKKSEAEKFNDMEMMYKQVINIDEAIEAYKIEKANMEESGKTAEEIKNDLLFNLYKIWKPFRQPEDIK